MVKGRRIGMLTGSFLIWQGSILVISFYVLVQKIQTIPLNAPKTSRYKVVQVVFQSQQLVGTVLNKTVRVLQCSGFGF
jgi:hypothetical protein